MGVPALNHAPAADRPDKRADRTKLLVIRADGPAEHRSFGDMPRLLRRGDVIVINDAATLPASFAGIHGRTGEEIEMRLMAAGSSPRHWRAVIFGRGNWRIPTELRPAPPLLQVADELCFDAWLSAKVVSVDPVHSRLFEIEFNAGAPELWPRLFASGKPIQYSYLKGELQNWDVQTIFAKTPVAIEAPSAAFALSWQQVLALRAAGVEIVTLTHATGISDTGDKAINALLPLPERTHLPLQTQVAVKRALAEKRRVIAVGTGAVRALESWGLRNDTEEDFVSDLRIGPAHERRIVSGLLTGLHESGASHLDLLASFVSREKLDRAYGEALERGYLWHEFGDACLVI